MQSVTGHRRAEQWVGALMHLAPVAGALRPCVHLTPNGKSGTSGLNAILAQSVWGSPLEMRTLGPDAKRKAGTQFCALSCRHPNRPSSLPPRAPELRVQYPSYSIGFRCSAPLHFSFSFAALNAPRLSAFDARDSKWWQRTASCCPANVNCATLLAPALPLTLTWTAVDGWAHVTTLDEQCTFCCPTPVRFICTSHLGERRVGGCILCGCDTSRLHWMVTPICLVRQSFVDGGLLYLGRRRHPQPVADCW